MMANEAWIGVLYFVWQPHPLRSTVFGGQCGINYNVLFGCEKFIMITVMAVAGFYPTEAACDPVPEAVSWALVALALIPAAVPLALLVGGGIVFLRRKCGAGGKSKNLDDHFDHHLKLSLRTSVKISPLPSPAAGGSTLKQARAAARNNLPQQQQGHTAAAAAASSATATATATNGVSKAEEASPQQPHRETDPTSRLAAERAARRAARAERLGAGAAGGQQQQPPQQPPQRSVTGRVQVLSPGGHLIADDHGVASVGGSLFTRSSRGAASGGDDDNSSTDDDNGGKGRKVHTLRLRKASLRRHDSAPTSPTGLSLSTMKGPARPAARRSPQSKSRSPRVVVDDDDSDDSAKSSQPQSPSATRRSSQSPRRVILDDDGVDDAEQKQPEQQQQQQESEQPQQQLEQQQQLDDDVTAVVQLTASSSSSSSSSSTQSSPRRATRGGKRRVVSDLAAAESVTGVHVDLVAGDMETLTMEL